MIKMLMMVGLGSFAGGILRFLLSRFVQVNSASSFPWGTAAVNLLGCFILGAPLRFVRPEPAAYGNAALSYRRPVRRFHHLFHADE